MGSHIQDNIAHTDLETQVLYNRSIAQLGMCAFRQGLLLDSYHCLQGLFSANRQRELLAQEQQVNRNNNRKFERLKTDKRQQIPPHMSIDLDLLEHSYLISCALLEAYNLARVDVPPVTNRYFQKRAIEFYTKTAPKFPGDSASDKIMAATDALIQSNWLQASAYIQSLSCWCRMPVAERSNILFFLEEQAKKTALNAFLIAYSSSYNSIALEELLTRFQLSRQPMHHVLANLLSNRIVHGSLDQSS